MKKLIPVLVLLFAFSFTLSAQSNKNKKKQRPAKTETQERSSETKSSRSQTVTDGIPSNPRNNTHKFAITGESGFKTLSGFGLNGTFYATPKVAVDLGLGLGLQLLRAGIRGRYIFLDKNFSPYVGLGLYTNPTDIGEIVTANVNGDEFIIDLEPSTFAQFTLGAEYVGNKGFVIGFNAGYSSSLTGDNWSTNDFIDEDSRIVTDILYGSSISLALNIGYAF